jgi:hypothetical protein
MSCPSFLCASPRARRPPRAHPSRRVAVHADTVRWRARPLGAHSRRRAGRSGTVGGDPADDIACLDPNEARKQPGTSRVPDRQGWHQLLTLSEVSRELGDLWSVGQAQCAVPADGATRLLTSALGRRLIRRKLTAVEGAPELGAGGGGALCLAGRQPTYHLRGVSTRVLAREHPGKRLRCPMDDLDGVDPLGGTATGRACHRRRSRAHGSVLFEDATLDAAVLVGGHSDPRVQSQMEARS